jgi:molybdopterin molybdotransferase
MLPLIRALQGDPAPLPIPLRASLAEPVGPAGPRAHYMRARLIHGDGLPQLLPFARQDSALLAVLAEADALLIRPIGAGPLAAGAIVDYLPI